jgi:hypothetical protein
VSGSIVEDITLARRVVAGGHRWRMARLSDLIACRMYHNGRAAADGLAKNLFAVFGFRVLPYLFAWGWLALLCLKPWFDLALAAAGQPIGVPLYILLICIGLGLALWLFVYWQIGAPLRAAVAYPVAAAVMAAVALRALWLGLRGRLVWKGRGLGRPRVRLF